jgi:hypothetical protein
MTTVWVDVRTGHEVVEHSPTRELIGVAIVIYVLLLGALLNGTANWGAGMTGW